MGKNKPRWNPTEIHPIKQMITERKVIKAARIAKAQSIGRNRMNENTNK